MKYLKDGVEQNLSSRVSEAQVEFDLAASEFMSYASITSNDSENVRIQLAAGGLLMSHHAPEALKLILEHPATEDAPEVQRIKAEVLLALGLGREAGIAYERWIGQGKCKGRFRRNWPGEPGPRDGVVPFTIMPKSVNDPCAALAPDLRARLKILEEIFGHPKNLPKNNYPPYPIDVY